MSSGIDLDMVPGSALAPGGFTGTNIPSELVPITFTPPIDENWKKFIVRQASAIAAQGAVVWIHSSISIGVERIGVERSNSEKIFDAIQSLYLSRNTPRDRRIAERITAIHRDAIAEDELIGAESLHQFAAFFLQNPGLSLPKITLTPDGTLRARWIHGQGDFVAIEFTGQPLVKLVAEIPRDNETARHFISEPVRSIVDIARAIGASFS